MIFGRPAREITNYYVRSPGESAPEPVKPTGPAPIELHSQPTLIVDQHHAFSSDENPGTGDAPLKTISTAVARAQPGKSGLHRYARWANADFGKAVETSSQMGGDEGMPQFESPERENYRFPNTHNDANAGVPELRFTTQGREIHLPSLVRHDFNGLLRFPEDGVPVGAFRNEPKTPVGAQTQIEIEWRDGTMERRWIPK